MYRFYLKLSEKHHDWLITVVDKEEKDLRPYELSSQGVIKFIFGGEAQTSKIEVVRRKTGR